MSKVKSTSKFPMTAPKLPMKDMSKRAPGKVPKVVERHNTQKPKTPGQE